MGRTRTKEGEYQLTAVVGLVDTGEGSEEEKDGEADAGRMVEGKEKEDWSQYE